MKKNNIVLLLIFTLILTLCACKNKSWNDLHGKNEEFELDKDEYKESHKKNELLNNENGISTENEETVIDIENDTLDNIDNTENVDFEMGNYEDYSDIIDVNVSHIDDPMSAGKYGTQKLKNAVESNGASKIEVENRKIYPNISPIILQIVSANNTDKKLRSSYKRNSGGKYTIKDGDKVLTYLLTTGDMSETCVSDTVDERYCCFADLKNRSASECKFAGKSFDDYKTYLDFALSKGYTKYNGSSYLLWDGNGNFVNLINLSKNEIITTRFQK